MNIPIADREDIAALLLLTEEYGVLDREMCDSPAYLDTEFCLSGEVPPKKAPKPMPPRLLLILDQDRLLHCVGEDEWYEQHPDDERYTYSQECYIVDFMPDWLANHFAMLPTYQRCGVVGVPIDAISNHVYRAQCAAEDKAYRKKLRAEELAKKKARKEGKLVNFPK